MSQELARLRCRKQELLIQSDANRRDLAVQLEPAGELLRRVDRVRMSVGAVEPAWWMCFAALVAGFLLARAGGLVARRIHAVARLMRVARIGLTIWQALRAVSSGDPAHRSPS